MQDGLKNGKWVGLKSREGFRFKDKKCLKKEKDEL